MDETDEGLMLAVREGDITKLGSLFDRHHAVLYDYLIRMTRSRTTAEDLVQEVFLRILKYRLSRQQQLYRMDVPHGTKCSNRPVPGSSHRNVGA